MRHAAFKLCGSDIKIETLQNVVEMALRRVTCVTSTLSSDIRAPSSFWPLEIFESCEFLIVEYALT
jgi:hypothetical protein